jgi:DNA ligase-1
MDTIHYTTPLLQADASTGKPKFWQGFVVAEGGKAYTYTETRLGADGKLKRSERTLVEGKNVGKKNETSPLQQAVLEIQADEAKKRKKGYGDGGKVETLPVPMACHPIERVPTFRYPAYAQPKMDGVRCLFDGTKAWSRGLELFPEWVLDLFRFDTGGLVVDGELYVHGSSFQQIQSAVTKANALTPQVEYWIFDLVMPEPFDVRLATLEALLERDIPDAIKLVPTHRVVDAEWMRRYHDRFCEMGFEGTILREAESPYEHKRSRHIVKVKDFVDTEFPVVGWKTGKGKEADQIMFTCQAPNGLKFDVTPNESIETRRQWLPHAATFIGKQYTVKHQGYYDSGIPRFPKGKAFRAKFDLPR